MYIKEGLLWQPKIAGMQDDFLCEPTAWSLLLGSNYNAYNLANYKSGTFLLLKNKV